MSGFTSSSSSNNIKTEIVRLVESQKEKASLLAYFTKYQDQQTEVFSDLNQPVVDEDDLKSIVENIKEKLGDIYELSALSFALPRKQLPFENASYDTQAYLLFFRANELSNYIYKQVCDKNLKNQLNTSLYQPARKTPRTCRQSRLGT
ncbi:unnamed protein product [Rhizophagus irregularis]|nr:unnamed protein product [Rhizophagus irregularis]